MVIGTNVVSWRLKFGKSNLIGSINKTFLVQFNLTETNIFDTALEIHIAQINGVPLC